MKIGKKTLLIVAVTIVALLASAAATQAHATSVTFTGTETCYPEVMGEWTLTDNFLHIRDMKMLCIETSDAPFMNGENHVIMNANLRLVDGAFLLGVGPMWGTYQAAFGQGVWQGYMYADGGVYHAQGEGSGDYAGVKVWLDTDHGVFTGRALFPHGD